MYQPEDLLDKKVILEGPEHSVAIETLGVIDSFAGGKPVIGQQKILVFSIFFLSDVVQGPGLLDHLVLEQQGQQLRLGSMD